MMGLVIIIQGFNKQLTLVLTVRSDARYIPKTPTTTRERLHTIQTKVLRGPSGKGEGGRGEAAPSRAFNHPPDLGEYANRRTSEMGTRCIGKGP